MNPTDPAFPTLYDKTHGPGMDLRTYMATAFLAADIATDSVLDEAESIDRSADYAARCADALIERLNAK